MTYGPIVIIGKPGNAVLISQNDWRANQKTMYLLNLPGMRESIQDGLSTPMEDCKEEIEW